METEKLKIRARKRIVNKITNLESEIIALEEKLFARKELLEDLQSNKEKYIEDEIKKIIEQEEAKRKRAIERAKRLLEEEKQNHSLLNKQN